MKTQMKIYKSWVVVPIGGVEIYNPCFRDMSNSEIENSINFREEWKPFGYYEYGFCRDTGIVYVHNN